MALQNILGNIALDTSVQDVKTSVDAVNTKTPALGQATMTVSTPVVIASNQSAIPVSGTVAVTGVATAAKQDALLTELQLKADLTETQPVSIASMPSTPITNANLDVAISTRNLEATQLLIKAKTDNIPAQGQALAAASTPVVLTAAQITTLTPPAAITGFALESTQLAESAKLPAVLGQSTMANSMTVAIASNQSSIPVAATLTAETTKVIGTVNPPAVAKGTQGANGFTTQDLKDAGRNMTNFFMAIQIVTTNADALMSLTGYKSGAAVVATTTPAVVTSGKTYRITSITMDYTTIVTTPGSVRFTLRANTEGVVGVGSPAVCVWEVGEPTGIAPVAGKKNIVNLTFPDGMEFAAGTGIGITQIGLNTVGSAAAVGYGRISITGYEY